MSPMSNSSARKRHTENTTPKETPMMRDSDLDAIRDRVDRNSFPQGDRARLLAEVERLREGITSALSTSRDMQRDMRSSVTLAFLQDALCDLLYPTEGES